MSDTDSPAGTAGGLTDLPEKMRVHALAKLISSSSREVIAALNEAGIEVRSAQSSIDRAAAVAAASLLRPDLVAATPPATPAADPAPVEVTTEDALAATTPEAPAAAPAKARRTRRATRAGGSAQPAAAEQSAAQQAADSGIAAADAAGTATSDSLAATAVTGAPAEAAATAADEAVVPAPSRRRRRTKVADVVADAAAPDAAAPDAAAPDAAGAPDVPAAAERPTPAADAAPVTPARGRRRRRVTYDPAQTPSDATIELSVDADAVEDDTAAVATPAFAPVFAPATPLFQAPSRRRGAAAADEDEAGAVTPPFAAPDAEKTEKPSRRRRRRGADDAADEAETPAEDTEQRDDSADSDVDENAESDDAERADDDQDDEDGAARRRRRRGRRGRGRGKGGDASEDDDADEQSDDADDSTDETGSAGSSDDSDESEESDDDADDDSDDESGEQAGDGSSRRRRRRRRRKGSADADTDVAPDDPPATVTKVRPARTREADDDGVQGVRGSTRLEAKRQRRRDGRDAGRRRQPILSEAEFLARREAVDRAMVVRERGDRVEVAVLEDDVLVEHFVADAGRDGAGKSMVGNIYLGRVQNVLPSMEAAFVDIGRGRNAVLYAGEVDWDAAGLGGKARRIEQALSSGDSVLVQVTKDPIGHKGARLTTQISLAGRYLVYVPSGGASGISRKLPDVERKRLKDMLKEIIPSEAGVIIRTASEGVSPEELERDVRRLQAQWDVVKEKSTKTGPNKPKAPTLLYEEPDLIVKVVRDQFNEDFSSLTVQGDDAWETISSYVGHVASELADRLHRHVGAADVFAELRIDEQLLKALDRKVWLPSGGTLVIDRTEAMTVVDVNTGKYTGSGGNLEETVTRNNLEAAEEVVRQLRLRDIGGIIVVDFIDMVLESNRDLVLRRLTECLSRDRTRHQVAEVTSLGLVQMTRKRVGGGLLEHFSTPCEHCRGRGVVIDTDPLTDHSHASDGGRSEGAGRKRNRGRRGSDGNGSTNGSPSSHGGTAVATPEVSGSGVSAELNGVGGHANGNGNGARGLPAALIPRSTTPAGDDEQAATGPVAADATGTSALDASVDVGAPAAAPEPTAVVASDADDAVEEAVVERSARRRSRRASRPVTRTAGPPVTAADPEVPSAAGNGANGTVPEVAVEAVPEATPEVAPSGSTTVESTPAAPAATVDTPAVPESAVEPEAPAPRPRRRGRVTRTAGAPSAPVVDGSAAAAPTAGTETAAESPAAAPPFPTAAQVAAAQSAAADATVAAVPPQPEPVGATKPRRARRAASRPAGPPPAGEDAAE